jgi:hypothetical protein
MYLMTQWMTLKIVIPEFKSWNDLDFLKALSTTLDKIVIDTTLQRLLMFYWVMGILDKFQEIKVMPIQVYEDPDCEGNMYAGTGNTLLLCYLLLLPMYSKQTSQNAKFLL